MDLGDTANNLAKNVLSEFAKRPNSLFVPNEDKQENTSRVFLFFSVDLMNATQYKADNASWASDIKSFYDIIKGQVIKAYKNAQVWKHSGDEVLFYIEIVKLEEILEASSKLYTAMMLAYEDFHKDLNGRAEGLLYFKGALWMAAATDAVLPNENLPPNIYIGLSTGRDFIGVHIDEGFRMSQHSSQGKIVLDSKIAYLLNKHTEDWHKLTHRKIEDCVKIVGFDVLKGIWKGRPYPVVWYTGDWSRKNLFLYDEHHTSMFAKDYLFENEKKIHPISHIDTIFTDLRFPKRDVEQIEEIIGEEKKPLPEQLNAELLTELHCATVCINCDDIENMSAFVLKRSEKRSLGGLWEFGCSALSQKDNYQDKIVSDYKKQFSIDIELGVDSEGMPIPLRVYEVDDSNRVKKGIVLFAKLSKPIDISSITDVIDRGKYSECKFLTLKELDTFEKISVSGFAESIRLAFESAKIHFVNIDENI